MEVYMLNLCRLLLSLTLAFSVCALTPSLSLSGNFDSGYRYDPADTSQAPWKGQDHSGDQQRQMQETLQRQQADSYRYQNEQRQRDDHQDWERKEQRRQDIQGNPYQQQHNFGTWPPR